MNNKIQNIQNSLKNLINPVLFLFVFSIFLAACSIQSPDINHWFVEPTLSSTTSPLPSLTITSTPTSTTTKSPTQTITSTLTETITSSPEPSFTNTLDITQTPSLSPTITLTPTRTLVPSRTPLPTLTRRPSRTPTITLTPTPPLAYFRINNLGQYSFVISPIRPEAIVSPGEDGMIVVELIGENGRTITKENINYSNFMGRHFGIAPPIEFELGNVSEYGRLLISSKDRYNRTMSLTSVDLLLLQLGSNKITKPKDLSEPFLIREPDRDDVIQGGVLLVTGVARILSIEPIIIECIDPEGNIVGSAEFEIEAPNQILSHIPYEVYVPYSVQESTNVRLTIRQESSSRLPGTIHLSSFEITLEP